MADISMNYGSVEGFERLISGKHNELSEMLDKMDSLVSGMENNWRGKAHQRFSSTFKSLEADLRRACDALEKYSKAVAAAKQGMKDTDSGSASSINGGIDFGGAGAFGGGGGGSR